MKVSELEGEELERWVAKAEGLNVVGKALCYRDPESGRLCIDPMQAMGEVERYVFADEDAEQGGDNEYGVAVIGGYRAILLTPIPEYLAGCPAWALAKKNLVMVGPWLIEGWGLWKWRATVLPQPYNGWNGAEHSDESPEVAICRAIVASKYGEEVPDE